jgi:hypothetical protein
MTTLSLPRNVRSITLEDGRTFVLDGSVPAPVAVEAVKSTRNVQTTPKPKARKARKPLTGDALAKQVAFWGGKASDAQIRRIKEAGSKMRPATLAKLTAIEARAELGRINPAAKLSVIQPEVLAALKA